MSPRNSEAPFHVRAGPHLERICAQCFLSPEIRAWINRVGAPRREICPYCGWRESPTVLATEVADLPIVALREKLTVDDVKAMQLDVDDVKAMQLDVIVGALTDLVAPTVRRRDLLVRRVLRF